MNQLESLLRELGGQLSTHVEAYVIGGFAMMKNGLKASTKDVDIVFQTEKDARYFIEAALGHGFSPDTELPEAYAELDAITVLRDSHERRFDVFVKRVLKGLVLTQKMWQRAKKTKYGNLSVSVAAMEDIFLFKSITSRPADLEDMRTIAETGAMAWEHIITEANNQPTPWRWVGRLYGRLIELEDIANIVAPITKILEPEAELAAAMELLIHKLGSGPLSLQEAAAILQEEDVSFVDNVFARMEQYDLVINEDGRFRLR